jgi:hypothetical protein
MAPTLLAIRKAETEEPLLLYPHQQRTDLRESLDRHAAACPHCVLDARGIWGTDLLMATFRPSRLCIGGRNLAKWIVERQPTR